MKLPHYRYIQALYIDRLPLIDIRKSLTALDLCLPSKRGFAEMEAATMDATTTPDEKGEVVDPQGQLKGFFTNHKLAKTKARQEPYAKLIVRLKLTPYFKKPSYDFDQLVRVRASLEYRTAMEGFILSAVTPEEAVTFMNPQFGMKLTKEDYLNYKFFFCDFTNMDPEGWNYHLLTAEPSEARVEREIMQRPDDLDFVKWRLGFPVNLEYSSMLQKIAVDAYYRYNKAVDRDNPNLQEANVLSMILMRAGDRMKRWEPKGSGSQNESTRLRLVEVRAMNQSSAPIHIGPLPDMTKGKGGNLVALPVGRTTRADQEKESKDGSEQGAVDRQRSKPSGPPD